MSGGWEPGCEGDIKKNSQNLVEHFFRGRKNDNTREYAWAILDTLAKKKEESEVAVLDNKEIEKHNKYSEMRDLEWVRSKDLVVELVPTKIPHEITLFRLLESLTKEKLIERSIDLSYTGKGKKPVYYRLGMYAILPFWAESREKLIDRVEYLNETFTKKNLKYIIAIGLLKPIYEDPESIIEKKFVESMEKLLESRIESIREMCKKSNQPFDKEKVRAYIKNTDFFRDV